MKKKTEPIIFWKNKLTWDWKWFAIGVFVDIKGEIYMLDLGFLHFMRGKVRMYPITKKKKK